MKNKILIVLTILLLVFSCASTAPIEESSLEPVEEVTPVVEEIPVEEAVEEDIVVNEDTGFEISAEIYEQTLADIQEFVKKLNGVISDENYNQWKLYLSEDYIRIYNSKDKLEQISSQSQILSENGIVLGSLKDYFDWVVVPSRSRASADDIVFIDDDHLTVYMMIKDNRSILYKLEKFDGNWLISEW